MAVSNRGKKRTSLNGEENDMLGYQLRLSHGQSVLGMVPVPWQRDTGPFTFLLRKLASLSS